MSEKYTFEDFIASVNGDNQRFVRELHDELVKLGCKTEVKSAKSGYVVSYILNKKTIANYVFRKKGLMVRIYANHINAYEGLLDPLPGKMAQAVLEAPVCRRLLDPSACNPRCAMGFDFILKGQRLKKCRNSAFMFLLDEESGPYISTLLLSEARASI